MNEVGDEPAPAGEEEPEEVVYEMDARLDGECGRGHGGPVTDLEEGPGCFVRGELDLVLGSGVEGLLVRHRPDRHEQIAEIVDGSRDIGHDIEASEGSRSQHSEGGAAGGAEDELVGGKGGDGDGEVQARRGDRGNGALFVRRLTVGPERTRVVLPGALRDGLETKVAGHDTIDEGPGQRVGQGPNGADLLLELVDLARGGVIYLAETADEVPVALPLGKGMGVWIVRDWRGGGALSQAKNLGDSSPQHRDFREMS